MTTVTLRRRRGFLEATDGRGVGIVVHSLADMAEMGYRYVPGSRGVWVRQ